MTKKEKKADIWMPWYVGEYLADTTHLNTEQHGAYALMLMAAWKRGGRLPMDDGQLASVTKLSTSKWKANRAILLEFFQEDGGYLFQKRVAMEHKKAKENSEKKAINGAAGAASKWGGSTDDMNRLKRSERLANARRLATHSNDEWCGLMEVCGDHCVRCNSDSPPVKDHITPIYQGGSDGIDNIQPLCRSCNSAKGAENIDHRPKDWKKSLAAVLAKRLANASQTPAPSPSPLPSLNPSSAGLTSTDSPPDEWWKGAPLPEEEIPDPSTDPAVIMAVALRKLQVSVTAVHPTLIDWVQKGVPLKTLTEAVALVRMRPGKESGAINPNYLASVLADIQNPQKSKSPIREPKGWWETVTGVTEKGKELGLTQTEDVFAYFRDRVYKAAGDGPWSRAA